MNFSTVIVGCFSAIGMFFAPLCADALELPFPSMSAPRAQGTEPLNLVDSEQSNFKNPMGSAPKGAPRLTPKATLRPRSKGSLDSRGNIENGRRLARPCLQCHGAHGVSGLSFRPTLAGQKAVYLREQLESFRRAYSEAALGYAPRSLRSELLMNRNAAGLGDDEIYDLSLYLSRLPCGGGVTPAARARPVAPKIARRCAGCHGKEGVSTDQNVPNLAGQKRMYLIQQLVEFQKSAHRPAPQLHQQRRFSAIMAPEVVALSAQDIDALATYYASLRCR